MRLSVLLVILSAAVSARAQTRPNILIAIADDQSFPHTSAYGDPVVQTPAFDRVAREGVLFTNAFTPAPGCSPMRAAFLTGREIWQLRQAGTHASSFPRDLPVFTEQLADAGYHVGMTGKGWGPGNHAITGWPHNPAGQSYSARKLQSPAGISNNDYAANFADFLDARPDEAPFCFWFGATEPHRHYKPGIGASNGLDPANVDVPEFLPDSEAVRGDIADYLFEIQWFDSHLQRMIQTLEASGQLEQTLIIVTSDNGMPFPRAKANLYEYGIHMPLAICWADRIPSGQVSDDLVSLIDVTQTIFDAAEVTPRESQKMPGNSLLPQLSDPASGQTLETSQPSEIREPSGIREAVYSGRERHSSSRYNTLGYPGRCIRTQRYLLIRNFAPERWPAGAPRKFVDARYDDAGQRIAGKLGPEHGGYHDIDDGPTLQWMIRNRQLPGVEPLFHAAVDRRPAVELYDVVADPACLTNLAESEEHAATRTELSDRLSDYLRETGDVRVVDPAAAEQWEQYPRYSRLRWFPVPAWAQSPADAPPLLPWLEERRPH